MPRKSSAKKDVPQYGVFLDKVPTQSKLANYKAPSQRDLLTPNYGRLARHMERVGHVPKAAARHFAAGLQNLRNSYMAGQINRTQYTDSFYEDIYDPLVEDYDYDLEEDYAEKE